MNSATQSSIPSLNGDQKDDFWGRISHSNFFIRLSSWEYWPIYIVNIPVVLVWLYYAIRARSMFFFSRANPAIETGGVMGESKIKILDQVADKWKPKTFYARNDITVNKIKSWLKSQGLDFPVICKPNIGERGFLISKVDNTEELLDYIQAAKVDFLVQEFIGLPIELSIMHYRFPGSEKGEITSICIKEFLTVTGDGSSTIYELMEEYPRAKLQLARFSLEKPELLAEIPGNGHKVRLEPIGNHSRGTTFLNGNHLIDPALTEAFDQVSHSLEGIHFCRYDLKCNSLEELKRGKNLKIMEINGVAGEPAHIYDPSYPVLRAYQDIFKQWKTIFQISQAQKKLGVKSMTFGEAKQALKEYRMHYQLAKD